MRVCWLTVAILANVALVHTRAELTCAETRHAVGVGLEECTPVPQLVNFSHLTAAVWLKEFEDEGAQRRHRVNCFAQQLRNQRVKGLVEHCERVTLQHPCRRTTHPRRDH